MNGPGGRGIVVDVSGDERPGGGRSAAEGCAVVVVAGFCYGSSCVGGSRDDRSVIGSIDGDGDVIRSRGTLIVGDGDGEGESDGLVGIDEVKIKAGWDVRPVDGSRSGDVSS